jgi:hypothetical protein
MEYDISEYQKEIQDRFRTNLPPMSDLIEGDIFGKLTLKIGQLYWLNSGVNQNNIKVKPVFFGQTDTPFLLRAENTCVDEGGLVSNIGIYDIHCTITQFHRYLEDMSRLRIFLVDKRNNKGVGMVVVKL